MWVLLFTRQLQEGKKIAAEIFEDFHTDMDGTKDDGISD